MDPLTMLIAAGAAMSVAGIGVGGGLFSAKQNYKYSSRLMAKQQAWMEKMSNTAHQREVADLRAAGLNPILSSHSAGSQVGSASSPSVNTPNLGDAALSGIKAGMDVLSAGAGIDNTKADTGLKEAEIETQKTAKSLNVANANKAKADADKAKADARLANAQASITERQGPYKTGFVHDTETVLKETGRNVIQPAWNWYSDNIGKPWVNLTHKSSNYLFNRQKSSATKKSYKNNSGKHSARPVKIERWNPAYGDRGYGGFY